MVRWYSFIVSGTLSLVSGFKSVVIVDLLFLSVGVVDLDFVKGGGRRTGFLLLENFQLFLKVITFSSVIWVGFRFKLGYFSIWVCLGEGDFG